ncbi:deazaflavin-dependent oxidoreductase (nitroreductase family) [Streptomyces sp. SLBN-118]|nr:deazaflavin-dependent oxidoreductase (nitroreductase family) [Streptomyces sp. SLBN-118]
MPRPFTQSSPWRTETPPPALSRPPGWRCAALGLPILFFRAGLGPLFGKRLLLLHHTGRPTGLDRRVVLEVAAYERADESWTVASGFGPKSDWYQNLREQGRCAAKRREEFAGNHPHHWASHFALCNGWWAPLPSFDGRLTSQPLHPVGRA